MELCSDATARKNVQQIKTAQYLKILHNIPYDAWHTLGIFSTSFIPVCPNTTQLHADIFHPINDLHILLHL